MLVKTLRDAARTFAARNEERDLYRALRNLDQRVLEDIGLERFGAIRRARPAR